ncbi:hypothetical protein [Streptomyces sp. HUAS TT7]|uniref:hypothetical protein n=1 Tax=Streptomyces sp. HUAS TT7 TaxID=3447507 RepID=UPI003F65FEBE
MSAQEYTQGRGGFAGAGQIFGWMLGYGSVGGLAPTSTGAIVSVARVLGSAPTLDLCTPPVAADAPPPSPDRCRPGTERRRRG